MLGDAALRVVDLGAGTGKFSRVLASLGHEVVAVEPDSGMREQLAAVSPGVEVLAGSAEAIPLPDGTVDAVTAAQSFHWFDSAEARTEIARVLRPGGVLAPVWNVRDDSVPWVAELSRAVLAGGRGSGDYSSGVELGPLFAQAERAEFRRSDEYTAASFLEFARSRSSYLTADAAARARIDAAVGAVTARLPETFELPYVTVAYRAVRA
ncbi:MAG TPA: class I SAM-dependent methyltransferase [Gaiellaceae bacterium]|jgi:SAM-dependent methyltransferase|nr:class I SAM-dependent methyltransferase [Gaiellaceae bacterium]